MKTIRLYHPHTHEGIAYDPPPEGIPLTVNDADAAVLEAWGLTTPPPALVDASSSPTADAPVADAVATDATPPQRPVANATDRALAPRHDRRVRVAIPLDDGVDAVAATDTRPV
ncbi:MAG: hypothetical protein NFW04_14360 [Candidatus Accumulibacter sp.]|uniref:hypothetical protein n=1 Tax=Accumulibacter sp. TaxID=2053492 RepID=UPI0025E26E70|nr:hypothetical protein [Accumulibacter sp.]MCM8599815.1 hypothetical protein [Accumulibacter sp.]